MNVFIEGHATEGKLAYRMYTAVVWAVSLEREVRVVLVGYEDADKERQTRKVFFSTDNSMSGKSPNMRLSNTGFKELLFYGVRAGA